MEQVPNQGQRALGQLGRPRLLVQAACLRPPGVQQKTKRQRGRRRKEEEEGTEEEEGNAKEEAEAEG